MHVTYIFQMRHNQFDNNNHFLRIVSISHIIKKPTIIVLFPKRQELFDFFLQCLQRIFYWYFKKFKSALVLMYVVFSVFILVWAYLKCSFNDPWDKSKKQNWSYIKINIFRKGVSQKRWIFCFHLKILACCFRLNGLDEKKYCSKVSFFF